MWETRREGQENGELVPGQELAFATGKQITAKREGHCPQNVNGEMPELLPEQGCVKGQEVSSMEFHYPGPLQPLLAVPAHPCAVRCSMQPPVQGSGICNKE